MGSRIALIRPPTVTKGTSFIATQFPLNLAGIAAALESEGYEVRIWDYDVQRYDEAAFMRRVKDFSPSIIGISCYTPSVINAHRLAALAKRCLPAVSVVVGGPHVAALPQETMDEFKHFDIGVIGEGEEVMVEVADRIEQRRPIDDVRGIIFKRNGKYNRFERRAPIRNLDGLPFPARHLLPMQLYKSQSHRGFSRSFLKITEIMTSRGCPNRCIFCASDVVMGRGVRFRSAVSVRQEIDECVERFGFNHFCISDDTFNLKEKRLEDICEAFARKRLTWNCNARVWPISKKTLSVMAASGCTGITFGVESGSPRILSLTDKNISIEQIEDAFRWSKEAGIKLTEADVIIGSHPSETKEDVCMTERLLRRISPDIVMISVIVPYPGTEIYRLMKEKRLIFKDMSWDSFVLFGREPLWRTEHFGPKELVRLQKKMIRNFYFRPLFMFRIIRKMKTIKELAYWMRGGTDFLLNLLRENPITKLFSRAHLRENSHRRKA